VSDDADETDVRADPAAYEVGRGEHGAFEYQPFNPSEYSQRKHKEVDTGRDYAL